MLLIINGKDYSKNILVGTYEVNASDDVVHSWIDGNRKEHRISTDEKTAGSMSMWFKNNADYWTFLDDLKKVKNGKTGAHLISVARNNRPDMKEAEYFVEMDSTRGRDAANQDVFRDFEMRVQER